MRHWQRREMNDRGWWAGLRGCDPHFYSSCPCSAISVRCCLCFVYHPCMHEKALRVVWAKRVELRRASGAGGRPEVWLGRENNLQVTHDTRWSSIYDDEAVGSGPPSKLGTRFVRPSPEAHAPSPCAMAWPHGHWGWGLGRARSSNVDGAS